MNEDSLTSLPPDAEAAATEAETTAAVAVPVAPTLGGTLRDARLARGMTISDVTQSIKFGARQIEALERDDFDKLPGSTFVRGLIRSYGKFLRLDEAGLLAQLDKQLAPVETVVRAPEDTGAQLPVHSEKRSPLPWLALAVAVLAIGIGLGTYLDWPGGGKPKAAAPDKLQAPSVRVEQAAVAEPVDAGVPAAVAADARQLIFIFDDKSWVEVKDATQKTIFAQNNPAGTRQVVSGKPPFELVIGNASAVQLQYEDKMVDLRPYTKVEVARLTLE